MCRSYISLMRGLKDLDLRGPYIPSDLVLIGDHAFPLAMNSRGQVLMAASLYGHGRIVVLGHPKQNTLLLFEGNKVSGVAGIYFSEHQGDAEYMPVYPQIPSSWMAVVIGKDFDDDLEFLLEGISEFDLQNGVVASELLIHGPLAFPIGTTDDGRAFLAGAYYGQGQVVVITHEGLLKRETLAPFFNNAIRWLDEGRNGVVGVVPDLHEAFNLVHKSGFNCKKTNFREDLSVFVCTAYCNEHVKEIQDFVAEGGGLLIGGHAWYWAQTHHGQNPMTDFTGNKILNKMGLSLLEKIIGEGSYKAPVPSQAIKDTYHFRHLLHRFAGHVSEGEELTAHEEECLKKLGGDCANYLHMKAHDCSSYTQVVSTLTDILKKSGMPQVSDSCPTKSPRDHLLLNVGTEVYKVCPDPDDLLPYLMKNNPLMPVVYNHRIKIHVNTAGGEEWISTGLYLSPGMKTFLAIPAEIVNKGWQIQIGCQTDRLHAEELKRAPCVHERFPVTSEMMQVWNLWGGLLYLVAPPKTQVNGLEVIVQMAVPAPYYKSGVTTAADWSLLRTAPSPWAELEFDNIILTVPSDVVQDLDRPEELATGGMLWLMGVCYRFIYVESCFFLPFYPGWMHAGYPIMTHRSTSAELVSTDHARSKGLWGPIHELGHNQQRACWEFPPNTTECTCNLWSVYVHEQVLGINRAKADPIMTLTKRKARAEEYAKGGRKLSSWDTFVALETYMQLQDKFGWDAFKRVFDAYHKMSNFPNDNHGKMNLYAETFSQAVGMNLAGFFKAWGWPIQTATEEKLSKLPPWSDHPMVQFA
uniref:Zgc:162193 n=1 Tax=Acanthochromis polyacanthus TaxID=80966 RepID=A0A3Q1G6J5_9TELE